MTRRSQSIDRDVGGERRCGIALTAIALLLGTGSLLSGCVAAPAYEPPAIYEYNYPAYPAYGYFDFDYWGGPHDWHHHWDHDHDDHGHGGRGH